ncbi:MAG: non-ribosomal peptide synthetase, partial [Vicinamibacterales bacterium]
MNRVTERLAHLTPEQRRAFELRLRQRGRPSPPPRIERRSAPSTCVLSFAQERMWFVEQLHPGTSANHISGAVRLEGELSLGALTTSLNAIVHRHQVLRSSYHDDGGRPLQRVAAEARCDVAVVAAAGTGAEARLRDAQRIAVEETDRPFDLTVPPLLRAVVIEVGERDHVLLLVVHHIAADAWSTGVLGRELTAGYNAALTGRPFPLADLPIQYPDYAAWQISRIDEPAMAGDIEWWRRRLEGVAPVELPADRPRPAVASAAGGRESHLIPRQVADGLSQLGQRHGATLFMTLLAAFKTLLARWTARADVAVGSPVAGRNWREVEDLIGLFVNLIVVRTDVAPHARFVDLLAAVRTSVSDALRRDEVPFEKVVDALGIERTLSAAPLTPVIFALQNVPTEAIALDGLQVSRFEFDRCTSRFDASVFVVPRADGLQTIVEYRRDLFEPESMRRLLASYARLLEAIVADPEQRVDRLPLVGDEERRRLTVDWNRTAVHRTGRACVHELFEACAMREPAACAVKDDARAITYADLNRDANRLANHLRRLGVRRDTTAVLLFEPSIAFVQAMLAVVKAGGAYVPVDASLPHERLRHVIADSGAVAVLTTAALRRSLPTLTVPCVCVDEVHAGSDRDDRAPKDAARADEPAYVIYTSGSTGEPKGVEITHAGLANLVQWHVATYKMTAGDRATQVANLAFDASVWEIWPSLASG